MPLVDLPLDQLRDYRPELTPPGDLTSRWAATLDEVRSHSLDVLLTPVASGLSLVDVFDVRFTGFGGDSIAAWLVRPAGLPAQPLPIVVEYNGYGGGRGLPHEHLLWASAGYAHLFMDTRGQGSSWGSGGVTADVAGSHEGAADPAYPGFLTRGVQSFDSSYVRRLICDAVRAVDAVRTLAWIDPAQVVVAGVSQGGGLALAVSGLTDGLAGVLADVPFLCHIRRGVDLSDTEPYSEVARYLAVHRDRVDEVFRTLAYFDGVHLGARATAPALFSVGLLDTVCPPSTAFAAFHAYGGPASIEVYPFNGHEGGQGHHQARQLAWLNELR